MSAVEEAVCSSSATSSSSSSGDDEQFVFAIDRGGTFTDVWARCPGGKVRVLKLLSEDPKHYKDAPTEAIRRILEQETGESMPRGSPVRTDRVGWIRMGTTVATNALLERKGERMALAITKGFRDLLHIGNQARPNIFDLEIVCPEVLYEEVVEVDERLLPWQEQDQQEDQQENQEVRGSTGERLQLLKGLDEVQLRADLQAVLARGVTSLAVLLLHSYTYGEHEQRVGSIARELGFQHVSLSSAVSPMVKAVPRGYTACSDAYLTPIIQEYLQSFRSGFEGGLKDVSVSFMQSDGGLTLMDKFIGSRAILSGPAGGVVGYAATTYHHQPLVTPGGAGEEAPAKLLPVIGFDMGGTSTDVSRYAGTFEHVFESTTAGITVQAPQLDINTVAAGGGSRLFFHSGMFVVGPESAGANPGPVCYKKGGPLAVTDANLVLGRLLPHHFPRIFGPTEDQPLDSDATRKAFEDIAKKVNGSNEGAGELSVEEVALGFIRVANEAMCRPIRALTQAKGHDTSKHILSVFGGAGGQHACAIARSLGMRRVFVHRYAGILSAYGLALADTVHEAQEPSAKVYTHENFGHLKERLQFLEKQCRTKLESEGFPPSSIRCEPYLHMRYQGTDCALMCSPLQPELAPTIGSSGGGSTSGDGAIRRSPRKKLPRKKSGKAGKTGSKYTDEGNGMESYGCFRTSFYDRYIREFGFVMSDRSVLVDDIRVRGIAASGVCSAHAIPDGLEPPTPIETTPIYMEGGLQTAGVYQLSALRAGNTIPGPAIILDQLSTILLEPECSGRITPNGDVIIEVGAVSNNNRLATDMDPIQLSIFSHRFMSLAEQMGRVLQRTSISTNIKERLDFSCAVFGPDGGLVSNAPHIPVHLGAMQETVQYQLRVLGDDLQDGDVLLSNHPSAGGSHLPDLTVITPVFFKDVPRPVFYVASRGHHADIGGITPGSMPPHSTSIHQEGAVFFSFKLVKKGVFQEKELVKSLMAPGKLEGSSGTRNLKDNLSDLKAQVAANHKGIQLVCELIEQYGLEVVQAYMGHIQTSAETAVREMLRTVGEKYQSQAGEACQLSAEDYMDDGTLIAVAIDINVKEGSAVIDFKGTGDEVWGNCNAPRAITVSAIIYCLRCMVGYDTPLNQGCLAPVTIMLPEGTILNPSVDAAVVGGNVQTSQRVVDVILKAFGACAASQGCMNNITFGDDSLGYYETVAGGAGAGPRWSGRSGVHTHMTNTRITDPEILEIRYPVHLTAFTLNPGTGGQGKYSGGDGVIRELRFRRPLTLSILTERRVFAPYGLCGGQPGKKGQNILVRAGGRRISLPSKSSVEVFRGDVFRLVTPGGGGYGPVTERESITEEDSPRKAQQQQLRGSVHDYMRSQETA